MEPLVFLYVGIWVAFFVGLVIVHIALSVAVWKDAAKRLMAGKGLFLVGPFIWFLTTLITGIFGFFAYWCMHHSTLKPQTPP